MSQDKEAEDMGGFSQRQRQLLAAALLGPGIGLLGADALAQKTIDRTLTVTGPVEIEARTATEDLTIRAGENGHILIHCIVKAQGDSDLDPGAAEKIARYAEANLPIHQDGNHLSIDRLGDPELLRTTNLHYELTVPVNTKLKFTSGAGDLNVEGISGPVEFSSNSGDMTANAVTDKVRAHTSSGDVILADAGNSGIEVETSSGDVTVRLAAQAGFDVSAHTSSGDISVGDALGLDTGDSNHDAHGKVRGGIAPCTIRTSSGDITIN